MLKMFREIIVNNLSYEVVTNDKLSHLSALHHFKTSVWNDVNSFAVGSHRFIDDEVGIRIDYVLWESWKPSDPNAKYRSAVITNFETFEGK